MRRSVSNDASLCSAPPLYSHWLVNLSIVDKGKQLTLHNLLPSILLNIGSHRRQKYNISSIESSVFSMCFYTCVSVSSEVPSCAVASCSLVTERAEKQEATSVLRREDRKCVCWLHKAVLIYLLCLIRNPWDFQPRLSFETPVVTARAAPVSETPPECLQ